MIQSSVMQCSTTVSLPSFITQNVSLADKNWFRTGGSASFFAEPTTLQELLQALSWAQNNGQEIFILGTGANILVGDDGFKGLVIRLALHDITLLAHAEEQIAYVQAGAGVQMHDLIAWCFEHCVGGLEEFSGIPGSVGGSVFINLHYFEFLLSQFLVSAQVLNQTTHEIINVDAEWFDFGYNTSTLQNSPYILLSATFKLKKINALQVAYGQGRHQEIIRHRTKRYPAQGTCGSFF